MNVLNWYIVGYRNMMNREERFIIQAASEENAVAVAEACYFDYPLENLDELYVISVHGTEKEARDTAAKFI